MKKSWLLIIVLIIAAVGSFLVWKFFFQKTAEEGAVDTTADVTQKAQDAASAGSLPEINPVANPLEKVPETNPIEKTNPFSDLKVNPFNK